MTPVPTRLDWLLALEGRGGDRSRSFQETVAVPKKGGVRL